jgi:bacteriocin-like protein
MENKKLNEDQLNEVTGGMAPLDEEKLMEVTGGVKPQDQVRE